MARIKDYIEPDRDLQNWEKWIKVREEEIVSIGQKIHRSPIDMVMNLHERVRGDREMKIILENAQIDEKPTVRGLPWEQPGRLKQKCYCEPVYEVHRKREEKGRPGIIEHVGVPQYILENEKSVYGISKRNKCLRLNDQYYKYKQKREDILKEKIKKIDPYRSDISHLFVKGNRPKPISKPLPELPDIVISNAKDVKESLRVYAVRINSTVIIRKNTTQCLTSALYKMQKESWHESCSSWSYYFNVPNNRVGRAKLFLRNLGTVTLRYCWKKIKQDIPFIPEETGNQVFFFNKNEDILSPGQSREVFFTFVSNDISLYKESWELSFCNVSFFEDINKKIVINLQGDTVEDMEYFRRKIDILKVRLNRKAMRKLIRRLLNDVFQKATSVEPQIYPYQKLLLESDLFLMKNPVCFYHQTEVMKLKEVYTQMIPESTWNLSINKWRDIMMKKEFADRMRFYEILKQSHCELIKPWQEEENHIKVKHSAVKVILMKLADEFDKVYLELTNESNVSDSPPEDLRRSIDCTSSVTINSDTKLLIREIFYIRMREHIALAMETCAGVLSSLDSNRWIHFDFCQ